MSKADCWAKLLDIRMKRPGIDWAYTGITKTYKEYAGDFIADCVQSTVRAAHEYPEQFTFWLDLQLYHFYVTTIDTYDKLDEALGKVNE